MRCNGLPNASNPGDLRKYIYMRCSSVIENKNREGNWLLKTNERTILTQNKKNPDLTRENLRKAQSNLGEIYSQSIQEVLGVLEEIDGELNNSKKLHQTTFEDLKRLKREIQSLLADFIDDFTYRILSHVERDMECNTPGISEHLYESSVFKAQVLMIQANASKTNVKDKFKENSPHSEINFPLLKMQLVFPENFQLTYSAIRGLWLNYDHFSNYCPSFMPPNQTSKHLNILQQTRKEWKKRKEILQMTLEQATKGSSNVQGFEQEEVQQRAIDIDKIYTEYEDELNKARRKSMSPGALNLTEFDVNLRSHRIVGGVFCIDHLDQPQQDKRLNNSSFIRSVTLPNKLTKKDFYQPYRPPPPPQPGVRRLPEEVETEMKAIERNLDKLITVSLQLPETVLWFEPPVVCRWELPEETRQSENKEEGATKTTTSNLRGSLAVFENLQNIKVSDQNTMKIVTDFNLYKIPKTADLFGVIKHFVIPRLPEGYCILIEYTETDTEKSEKGCSLYLTKESTRSQFIPLQPSVKRIMNNLVETNSPRSLHMEFNFDRVLQIIQPMETETKDSLLEKDEFDPKYMFSELIQDLEHLCEQHTFHQDAKISEINSKLSSARSSLSKEEPSNRRFSSIIIRREVDVLKEKHTNPVKAFKSGEDSDSESSEEEIEMVGLSHVNPELFVRREASPPKEQPYFGKWCTRDVHDTKFNEDKLSIQFRTGRLGYFGFAANRYSNMPYQTWELKPDLKSPIIFTLTAAIISLEIQITNQGYRLNAFQGGTNESLTEMIGQLYSLDRLKEMLTNAAVDIFPDEDAFCYTEGSCEKNYVMEMHLYACMAALGLTHNFSWSRWNLLSGSRAAVLLMRELQEGKKAPNHSTLFITPLKASVVNCTEVSTSFSTAGIAGMKFYADLYHLANDHSLLSSKEKQATMDPVLRDNIFQLLQRVRPLSFC